MIMDILILILSYVFISIIVGLFYVVVLLSVFFLMKKVFRMNESKWTSLFKMHKGLGLYYALIIPWLITILIMFPIIVTWFEFIGVENNMLASVSIILILLVSTAWKFYKGREDLAKISR
ncbi:hypothetical protein [Oceanobacillus sp. 1P07AA]|uniref:hypothetical protein n=1 Tax=Oceanobacillus sp. 1P07AA TaxID=3132293 RepID=UPI0039A5059C